MNMNCFKHKACYNTENSTEFILLFCPQHMQKPVKLPVSFLGQSTFLCVNKIVGQSIFWHNVILPLPILVMWAGQCSRYSDWLWAGRFGDRIPVGGEIFRTCPDQPWGPTSLLYNGYLVFPGLKSCRGVTLSSHPLLVPWSTKVRAIPLLPLWAIRPVQSLSACTRATFKYHVDNFNPTNTPYASLFQS